MRVCLSPFKLLQQKYLVVKVLQRNRIYRIEELVLRRGYIGSHDQQLSSSTMVDKLESKGKLQPNSRTRDERRPVMLPNRRLNA